MMTSPWQPARHAEGPTPVSRRPVPEAISSAGRNTEGIPVSHPHSFARRRLLAGAGSSLPLVALAACGAAPANDRRLRFTSLEQALRERARLSRPRALPSAGSWGWAQTLAHCAQSIEYSMTGFPEPKSALFQRTAGAAAFQLFAWHGRMVHDLTEPIPGAPALAGIDDVDAAVARLERAVAAFENWQRPLQPHFAYGALDKAAYAQAHAMHLANHFSAFDQGA